MLRKAQKAQSKAQSSKSLLLLQFVQNMLPFVQRVLFFSFCQSPLCCKLIDNGLTLYVLNDMGSGALFLRRFASF